MTPCILNSLEGRSIIEKLRISADLTSAEVLLANCRPEGGRGDTKLTVLISGIKEYHYYHWAKIANHPSATDLLSASADFVDQWVFEWQYVLDDVYQTKWKFDKCIKLPADSEPRISFGVFKDAFLPADRPDLPNMTNYVYMNVDSIRILTTDGKQADETYIEQSFPDYDA